MADLYLVLLHHPTVDKNGAIVTTALTNMDIHDIARSARTFGVKRFYVAHPVKALRVLAAKIMEHWDSGYGSTYNVTRKDALSLVALEQDLDSTIVSLELATGLRPRLVVTSARDGAERTTFAQLRRDLSERSEPHLLVLGTGWGLAPEVTARADVFLEPIRGVADYNHLSVRSAAAIILDRLRGAR
ncbi:MAG TPA: RNA methyltransferase [Candidatus Acidoferrales bacterium]|nr:RNA methyltransferase [Candidatus Acidoferrales bacterium]